MSISIGRRDFMCVSTALIGAGLIPSAFAAGKRGAFDSDNMEAALKAINLSMPGKSDAIKLQAPEIAENGNSVPIKVSVNVPKAEKLVLIIENNPRPLTSVIDIHPDVTPYLSTYVRMAETGKVYALAKAGDKWHMAVSQVRVTVGGCAPA